MNRLDRKVALISGGARGIGAETGRLMVAAGAQVVLGDAALYAPLEVSREADWTTAVARAVERFGRLDILVNNAGILLGKSIEEATLADWQRLCAVNLTGAGLVVDGGITAQ